MDRRGNSKRGAGGRAVKAKGGAAPNSNAPKKLSDRFDRIVTAPKRAPQKVVVVKAKPKTAVRKPSASNKRGKPAAGNRGRKNDPKKKGRRGKGPAKEAPKSAEDLDLEMASYWHKAGKGPDPMQAKLDAEMDSYFASKDAPAETAATEEAAEKKTE